MYKRVCCIHTYDLHVHVCVSVVWLFLLYKLKEISVFHYEVHMYLYLSKCTHDDPKIKIAFTKQPHTTRIENMAPIHKILYNYVLWSVVSFLHFTCSVLIPSSPLETDGPSLQHLNKGRPRPVRHHRRKPAALKQQANDTPDSVWEEGKTTIEEPDAVKTPVKETTKPKTPETLKNPEPVVLKLPEPQSPQPSK